MKKAIENASQEIVMSMYYFTLFSSKFYRMIEHLYVKRINGETIDKETFEWTSLKNKPKIINYCCKLGDNPKAELKSDLKTHFFVDLESDSEVENELELNDDF